MCGRLPFSTEYNSGVPGPQGAGAAPTLQWNMYMKSTQQIQFEFTYI